MPRTPSTSSRLTSRLTAQLTSRLTSPLTPPPTSAQTSRSLLRDVRVADLDLDLDPDLAPDGGGEGEVVLSLTPAPGGPPVRAGAVYALVRLRGRPVATVLTTVPDGADPAGVLTAAFLARGPNHDRQPDRTSLLSGVTPPRTTVVVATRERADTLGRALDSLLAQDHPDFRVVVVDNAPVTPATRELIDARYADRLTYVHEPVPGLATAHNAGVAATDSPVVAFTDDDVVADPHWLSALTAPFAADPRTGCVTGLILPARLTTPAQVLLESHGGFAKGFAPRLHDPAAPPADEPLFPFTAGSFGSGANMAFRVSALRAVGGFDPATGTGTPARGGDDLYAFVRILTAGHRLRYTPDALVWHHHRETWQDLRNQAYGYGAGLTAYLTAVLCRHPALLPALLAKLPRGLAHARAITAHRDGHPAGAPDAPGAPVGAPDAPSTPAGAPPAPGAHGALGHPWPRTLSRLERRGMLYGPLGYAKARWGRR
ncbi:glycosyltransferase [Streptomyces sp. PSRA5]|uniref:glycosyltransferase n=1 Tax=Streptomyces panacea TaxID=3035064 RepID=UPI00339CF8E2